MVGPRAVAAIALPALLAAAPGCTKMAITWWHLTGGDTIEARFKLTEGKLAVVLDDPQGMIVIPSTFRVFQQKLNEELVSHGVKSKLVPFEQWDRLRTSDPEYQSMKLSRREIGEKLGADQVLYLDVTDFRLKRDPSTPIFQGRFAVRVSVYSTERKRDVRLWPEQEGGESVVVETQPQPADQDVTATDVARELADKMAVAVSKLFYDHKEKD
jgi:hypothetical protein